MRYQIHPSYAHLLPFCRQIPALFASEQGQLLHNGRNCIKVFQVGDERIVVKSYGPPSLVNRLIYGRFRKSKAQRAYEHAAYLRQLGIETPNEMAWIEVRHRGLLQECYYLSAYAEGTPFSQVIDRFPSLDNLVLMDDLAEYLVGLHACGVLHEDLNAGNILYRHEAGGVRFSLVDINRMHFRRSLSRRSRLKNLRRLTHKTEAYLYIVRSYIVKAGLEQNRSLLQSCLYLFAFSDRTRLKERIKQVFRRK